MRRILLLTLDFPPRRGGVARYLYGLAEHWKDQIFVVAPPETGSIGPDQAAPFEIKREKMLYDRFWPRWFKSFRTVSKYRSKFDTLWISHILPLGTVALLAKWFLRKDYFIFMHSMDFALATRNGWKRWLTAMILRGAKLVVTNSHALEARAQVFVGSDFKTLVVYPFVHHGLVRADLEDSEQEPRSMLTMLTVGRLVGRKGHHKVLEAMSKLVAAGMNQIQYVIVGSGMEYHSLLKHAQKLNIEPLVKFYQNVGDEDLPRMYRQADVFVMPTEVKGRDLEGFGIVYLEAGLSGLPVIASKLPGVDEAVVHGQTGVLVEAGNSDQIAAAIRFLAESPEMRTHYGRLGRKRVMEEFLCEHQAKKLTPFMT